MYLLYNVLLYGQEHPSVFREEYGLLSFEIIIQH